MGGFSLAPLSVQPEKRRWLGNTPLYSPPPAPLQLPALTPVPGTAEYDQPEAVNAVPASSEYLNPDTSRLTAMEAQSQRKPGWKDWLFKDLIPGAASIGIGAVAGGLEGAAGGAAGYMNTRNERVAREDAEKNQLLEDIASERKRIEDQKKFGIGLQQNEALLKRQEDQALQTQSNADRNFYADMENNRLERENKNKPIALGEESRLVDPITGKVIVGPSQNKPLNEDRAMTILSDPKSSEEDKARAKSFIDQAVDMKVRVSTANGKEQLSLSPEGEAISARMFATTGQMPSLGMGNGGVRTRIINKAAEMYPSVDIASNKASYDSNKASLVQMKKSYDAIESFSNTAQKNLDILVETASKIPDANSPLLNTPIRYINEKILGGSELPAFRAALRIDINEIAKIVSNPNMTGVLSDTARREVEDLVPDSVTVPQLMSVAKILRRDMANRRTSIKEQISAIEERIRGNQPQGNQGGDGGVVKWGRDASGRPVRVP